MPARLPATAQIRRILQLESPLGFNNGQWHNMYEDWALKPQLTQAATTNNSWDATGTGDVAATDITHATGGGITIATATTTPAADDATRIFPLAVSAWGTATLPASNTQTILETVLTLPATITSYGAYFGFKLTDTEVFATDDDQVMFGVGTTSMGTGASLTEWNVVESIAGTDTFTDTNVTFAASTSYLLRLVIGTDRRCRCYLNNSLVRTTSALTASAAFLPTFAVITRTTAVRSLTCRYIRYARTLGL